MSTTLLNDVRAGRIVGIPVEQMLESLRRPVS